MGDDDDTGTAVGKGDKHVGARVDEETHKKMRIAAAERDEPMTDFIRHVLGEALADLDEGNQTAETATASS